MRIHVLGFIATIFALSAISNAQIPPPDQLRHPVKEAPIFNAIRARDLEELRKLIASGASIESRSVQGFTPIMWASYGYGDTRIGPLVDFLIEKGADLNARTRTGQTALMWAARDGNLIAAMALVNAKAKLDLKDNDGFAAIHFTANWVQYDFIMVGKEESQAGIAAAIVDAGGDANLLDSKGNTALMWAAANGHGNVLRELIRRSDLSLKDKQGRTALTRATWHGKDSRHVKALLDAGAKVRFVDALALGDAETARKLINEPDALTAQGPYNESTLLFAAQLADPEIVRELLARGADTKAVDRRNFSAVMLATGMEVGAGQMGLHWMRNEKRTGRIETIRILAKAGANLDHVIREGDSLISSVADGYGALAFAVHAQDLAMVKTLLELGASPNCRFVKESYNMTDPLAIAVESKHYAIAEALLKAGANPNTDGALRRAISTSSDRDWPLAKQTPKQRADLIHLLLQYGADPNQMNEYGDSPLADAIDANDVDVVEILIAKYAQVRIFDSMTGESMLMKAVRSQNPEIVKKLLARGADPMAKSPRGFTARWLAESKGYKTIAALLLQAEQKEAAKKKK